MPVMDGYTATREIRRDPRIPPIPIIAMTASAMAGDKARAIDAGMNDHIAKPIDVEQFFLTLARWLAPEHLAARNTALPGRAASGDGDAALPVLPGIDLEAGLAVVMGNTRLLRRLLVKFRDTQSGFAEQFIAAMRQADRGAGARCAHSLRGAAGNVGARKVQAAAADLERACASRETRSVIDAALAAVVAALAPVLTGLARLDSGRPDVGGELDELDRPAVQAQIERLQAQLDGIDAEAADTVRELVALTQGTRLSVAVGVVANAIAEFRFEAASAALKHVRWDP